MDLQKMLHQGQGSNLLSGQFNQQQESADYQLKNLSIQISSTHHSLVYQNCLLQIYENCIDLRLNENKLINILFSNISSIGIADINLLVFLQGNEEQQEQEQEQDEQNQHNSPLPQLLKLIKQTNTGTFNLQGNYSISISFKQYNNQVKKQVHQIMIGYLKSQQEQQQQNLMGDMISADDINQDGTINKIQQQNSQNSQSQSEDQNS